jgi:thiamine biosynthesis protein ThiS
MELTINGQPRDFADVANVAQLLGALALERGRVAVMVNGRVVRRADHESSPLAAGDKIEIITMVGGG